MADRIVINNARFEVPEGVDPQVYLQNGLQGVCPNWRTAKLVAKPNNVNPDGTDYVLDIPPGAKG